MADKTISELEPVGGVETTDNFVLSRGNLAKRITGQTLITDLARLLDGHGGIKQITLIGKSGLIDTYRIDYTDRSSTTFTVTNGAKGDKGDTGTGVRINGINYHYADGGDVGTTPPVSGWKTSPPIVSQGQYLWSRTTVYYSDGNTQTSYSVARQGVGGMVNSVNNISPDGGNVTLYGSNITVSQSYPSSIYNAIMTLSDSDSSIRDSVSKKVGQEVQDDNTRTITSISFISGGSTGNRIRFVTKGGTVWYTTVQKESS